MSKKSDKTGKENVTPPRETTNPLAEFTVDSLNIPIEENKLGFFRIDSSKYKSKLKHPSLVKNARQTYKQEHGDTPQTSDQLQLAIDEEMFSLQRQNFKSVPRDRDKIRKKAEHAIYEQYETAASQDKKTASFKGNLDTKLSDLITSLSQPDNNIDFTETISHLNKAKAALEKVHSPIELSYDVLIELQRAYQTFDKNVPEQFEKDLSTLIKTATKLSERKLPSSLEQQVRSAELDYDQRAFDLCAPAFIQGLASAATTHLPDDVATKSNADRLAKHLRETSARLPADMQEQFMNNIMDDDTRPEITTALADVATSCMSGRKLKMSQLREKLPDPENLITYRPEIHQMSSDILVSLSARSELTTIDTPQNRQAVSHLLQSAFEFASKDLGNKAKQAEGGEQEQYVAQSEQVKHPDSATRDRICKIARKQVVHASPGGELKHNFLLVPGNVDKLKGELIQSVDTSRSTTEATTTTTITSEEVQQQANRARELTTQKTKRPGFLEDLVKQTRTRASSISLMSPRDKDKGKKRTTHSSRIKEEKKSPPSPEKGGRN